MKTIRISCPGKIILMGEHAVVYGKPAIVAAVNRRMTYALKTDICHPEFSSGSDSGQVRMTKAMLKQVQHDSFVAKIKSDIPIGCGMGSSASWSVIQAVSKIFFERALVLNSPPTSSKLWRVRSNNNESDLSPRLLSQIYNLAYQFEKIYHVNPSGADPAICTYGGILWYKKTKSGHKIFKKLKIKRIPKFVLINTGLPKETTAEMVHKIKTERQKNRKKIDSLFETIEQQTKIFLQALEKNNRRLMMNSIQNCESCLEDLGVVGDKARNIIGKIEKIGGVAKVTGAGGLTSGSGMLLCYHPDSRQILDLAKKLKLEAFRIKLGGEGLTISNF